MDLNTIGEFGLIDLISLPHPKPELVIVGIGDDCAVLPYHAQQHQLISCDLMVEDVHFIRGKITPYQLGYKLVAVNLSDIAAMGGMPTHIVLSVALPPDYTVQEWQELYRGIGAICDKYGVNLIGGDTTSSKDKLALNVTVLGLVDVANLHLRSMAKEGDAVFVTGSLGGSRAGLELLYHPDDEFSMEMQEALMKCHYQPEPCCYEVSVLNQIAGSKLHALNDISDGLASECHEIATASGKAIVLYQDQIPMHKAAVALAEKKQLDGVHWALTGGEDYQLVGTMDGDYAEEICAAYKAQTGKEISIVGYVTEGNGVYLQDRKDANGTMAIALSARVIEKSGYNHFQTLPKKNLVDEAIQQLLAQSEKLQKQLEKQATYQHDFNNHMSCLLGLLESKKYQDAERYLQQMLHAMPVSLEQNYHNRAVLNVLCNQKALLAKDKNIEFQFQNAAQEDLLAMLSDYDLCTLVGNLLDNGLDHADGEDPYLYLDLFCDDAGNTILRMENSCSIPPVLQHGVFTSCKADAASHGKGMQQIANVVEENHGVFSWQFDKEHERFITQCMFRRNA